MLEAVIMGLSRSGPGLLRMRSRTLRFRSSRILRLRRRVFLVSRLADFFRLCFRGFLGIVVVTREPSLTGIVRMCSYLHYSRISGGFRAFSRNSTQIAYKSRLVKDYLPAGYDWYCFTDNRMPLGPPAE